MRESQAAGVVRAEGDAPARTLPGDTATVRVTIGAEHGCERLEQRVVHFAQGRSLPRTNVGHGEVMYVVSGRATLELDGERHALEPDDGAFVAAGETFVVDNADPERLVLVSVLVPVSVTPLSRERRVVVSLREREEDRADEQRTFRVLVGSDTGCRGVTQFVGFVQTCRAPDHSHPYDEVGYILAGRGYAHLDGASIPIGPGSCFHLPPGKVHCIENAGAETMRILGVLHPADSPAARSYDAASPAESAAPS